MTFLHSVFPGSGSPLGDSEESQHHQLPAQRHHHQQHSQRYQYHGDSLAGRSRERIIWWYPHTYTHTYIHTYINHLNVHFCKNLLQMKVLMKPEFPEMGKFQQVNILFFVHTYIHTYIHTIHTFIHTYMYIHTCEPPKSNSGLCMYVCMHP